MYYSIAQSLIESISLLNSYNMTHSSYTAASNRTYPNQSASVTSNDPTMRLRIVIWYNEPGFDSSRLRMQGATNGRQHLRQFVPFIVLFQLVAGVLKIGVESEESACFVIDGLHFDGVVLRRLA